MDLATENGAILSNGNEVISGEEMQQDLYYGQHTDNLEQQLDSFLEHLIDGDDDEDGELWQQSDFMSRTHTESPSLVSTDSVSAAKCTLTGRPPYLLYLSCDGRGHGFSEYHVLLRKQIELFEAGPSEIAVAAQGRNKPIVLGQVGIRCRHCAYLPYGSRTRGAVYFPSKLHGVYQMAQSMAKTHLLNTCTQIPRDIRDELIRLRETSSAASSGMGKTAWAERVKVLGVFEDEWGLRYTKTILG